MPATATFRSAAVAGRRQVGKRIRELRISAFNRLVACTGGTLNATVPAGLRIAAKPVPLADVEWAGAEHDSARRTVFTLD